MNKFPFLSLEDRKVYFEQTGAVMNLYAPFIEKDFWVCWVLDRLYKTPDLANHLTFKGGTSLSKVWGVIDRFSEDIDLTINRDFFGYGGTASPENADSNKKQKEGLKGLRRACQDFIRERLLDVLDQDFRKSLPASAHWTLSIDEADNDGQTLLFEYPSCWADTKQNYVRPIVKMEFGARSDPWPVSKRAISAFVAQKYPAIFEQPEVIVLALSAERTFWEKVMLIHEETFRPSDKRRAARMARHYYDLWCLITKGVADSAIQDKDLFSAVASHRAVFFRQSWVDYSTLKRGTLVLVPHERDLDGWAKDYTDMQEMFLGETLTFGEILETIRSLESRLNSDSTT